MIRIIQVLKNEWKLLIPLLLITFFLGNIFLYGWQFFFWPNTSGPVLYEGDGFAFFYNFKRLAEESWFYTNHRANYPWVSNFSDFPQSDFGNYLFIKLVTMVSGSIIVASNLYLSVSFPLAFLTTYVLLRVLQISKINSILGAFSYAFLTFHFVRVGHVFFTWYFVVPCYIYLFYRLLNSNSPILFTNWKTQYATNLRHFLGLMLLTCFGGYFALFTLFGLIFCALPMFFITKKFWHTSFAIGASGLAILLGTFCNIYPTVLYGREQGPNLEALIRVPLESELYALKFSQLFIPAGYHISHFLSQIANFYNFNSVSVNENASAIIGLLPSIGVMVSIVFLLYRLVPTTVRANSFFSDKRVLISGLFILFYVLFASIGGIVALYALLVNSTARGWNRISIYIACFGLISLTVLIDYAYQNLQSIQTSKWLKWSVSAFLCFLVLIDQTPVNGSYKIYINVEKYQENDIYYQKIEQSLPKGSAIFQLPFQTYPGHPVNGMGAYTHFEGHIHSQHLKWSFGGIKWREGEWFYRHLAGLPLKQQLDVAKAMGFKGVLLDKRAFCDGGKWIEQAVTQYAAQDWNLDTTSIESKIIRNQKQGRVFVPLANVEDQLVQRKLANQHLIPIGYEIQSGYIPQSNGQWNDIIDFRRETYPYFLKFVDGLSSWSYVKKNSPEALLYPYKEDWPLNAEEELQCEVQARKKRVSDDYVPFARWSDARLSKTVKLTFDRPLPSKLRLQITASAVANNQLKPAVIKIGRIEKKVQFTELMQTHQLEFEIPNPTYELEIIPAEPTDVSLETRGRGKADRRLLSLHLQSIRITPLISQ